jgi:hypothetical protein
MLMPTNFKNNDQGSHIPYVDYKVYTIENKFFGSTVTFDSHNIEGIFDITLRIQLPILSKYYEYVNDIEYLILKRICMYMNGTLIQEFNNNYLCATNTKVLRDNNDIYIMLPFDWKVNISNISYEENSFKHELSEYKHDSQIFTSYESFPLISIENISLTFYCEFNNIFELINIKCGNMLQNIDYLFKSSIITNCAIYCDIIKKKCKKNIIKYPYTSVKSQVFELKPTQEYDRLDTIALFKQYINTKLPQDLINYIFSYIFNKGSNEKNIYCNKVYMDNLFIKAPENVINHVCKSIIITITDDNPQVIIKNKNILQYYPFIENAYLQADNMIICNYNNVQLYKLFMYKYNKNIKKNVANILFDTYGQCGLYINDTFKLNLNLKLTIPKYGSYVLTVYYILDEYIMIMNNKMNC